MTDSKLLNLLKNLNENELRDLEKFVASPYFSKGRDLMPLLKALKPFYPEFNDQTLTIEFLFKKIFPGKKFETKKSYNLIKTLSSQLFGICKDFLIQLELSEDQKVKAYYLLNQLRKKKMYKEFDKEYQNSQSEKSNLEKGNIKDFVKNYLITAVLTDYTLDKDEFENSFENTLSMSENIITAALISCFKFEDEKNIARVYNLDVRSTIMNAVLDNIDPDKLMKEIEKNDKRFSPYIKIYYMIYRMNRFKDNIDFYFETKELLEKSFHLFGQSENHVLWNIMLTYCNTQVFTEKDSIFRQELHYIHSMMCDLNIYKRSKEEDFHIILFRNIVMTAANTNKYDWLEDFINKYSDELHIEHREDMKNYSHASLCYFKGEFEKALDYLTKIKYDLFLYKHDVKRLQLKIYYELNYSEELISLIDTLQHYLKNTNDLSVEHKAGYRNFLNYMRELLRLKNNSNTTSVEIEFLEKKILSDSKTKPAWILEKLGEMKSK